MLSRFFSLGRCYVAKSILFLGIGLLPLSNFAEPGGWVSSGGEIFKFAKNPWFVKNTVEVKYCVSFSANEFSISYLDTLKLIEEGLAYWKTELNGERPPGMGAPIILGTEFFELATQNFIYSPKCGADTALEFKFGYQNLNADEIDKLKDPTKFVGVTIRKEYDESQMKGRGIIYISGDRGVHAYSKASPETLSEAWRYPKLLQYAITHELGHVFGIPHTGSGLMSEVFLDQILIKKFASLYQREPMLPFVKSVQELEICPEAGVPQGSQKFVADFFGLKNDEDCLRLEVASNRREFSVLTRKRQGLSDWKKIGTLYLDMSEFTDFSLKPSVVLQLPEAQTVFRKGANEFLLGPLFQSYKMDAHFTFGTSLKPTTAQVDISPDSFVVYSLAGGKLRQVVAFGNPLTFFLVKPF